MKRRLLALASVMAASIAVPARAATYTVDTVHSTVMFRVKHMNASYAYGRFNNVTGSFSLDEADPSKSSFDFVIKVASVDTADAGRDAHLKKTDMFNAEQFPTITFKSKGVKPLEKGKMEVSGELTMHGVTKPLTAVIEHTGTAKGMRGGTIAGIESTFKIKRSDFGMKGMIPMLGDEVTVTVSSEGAAK